MSDHVTLKQLAQETRIDRSNVRKYVLACGVTPVKIRDMESRQLVLAITQDQADFIIAKRTTEGFGFNNGITVDTSIGFFYIIQPVPELDPRRVKLGFTNSVKSRLLNYQTICPNVKLVTSYPCKQVWEIAAMDSITRDCNKIGVEVFECDNIDALIDRANGFFENMPKL